MCLAILKSNLHAYKPVPVQYFRVLEDELPSLQRSVTASSFLPPPVCSPRRKGREERVLCSSAVSGLGLPS